MTREWIDENLENIANKYYDEIYDCYFNVLEDEEITLKDSIFNFLNDNKINFLKSIEKFSRISCEVLSISYNIPTTQSFGCKLGLFTIIIEV